MGEQPAKNPMPDCEVNPKHAEPEEARKLEEVIEPVINSTDLSAQQKAQQIVQIMKVTQESFSGPLPHPEILKGYQQLIPDAPERILRMAEKEQSHRQSAENEMLAQNRRNIEGSISANRRSQILAACAIFALLIAGVFLTRAGYATVGGIIFSTTIIGMASIFITGKLTQRSNTDADRSVGEDK